MTTMKMGSSFHKDVEEDDLTSSNSTNAVTHIFYKTKIQREVMKEEYFSKVLEKVKHIDFIEVYCQPNEFDTEEQAETRKRTLAYIRSLRAELKRLSPDSKDYQEIKNKLQKFESGVQVKLTMVVRYMLGLCEELGHDLIAQDTRCLVYTGTYWKIVKYEKICEFISNVCVRVGLNQYHAAKSTTLAMLGKQFYASAKAEFEYDPEKVNINLLNGTFSCVNNQAEFHEFRKEDMCTYQLPFEYDPEAKAPKFMAYLNRVMPDKDAQMVMAEYIAYILNKSLNLEKCLVLTGNGANGKSVFGDIVTALLGKENVSSFSLKNLCDNSGYYRYEMENYLLNYSSEINAKQCDPDIVKQLISREPVGARSPYKTPVTISNYCRLMFNANILPKGVEQSYGYFRRFMFLKFDVTIPETERNPNLAREIIAEELPGVFNWVIEGLHRLMLNKSFTKAQKIENAFKKAEKESNSVALFIEESGFVTSDNEHEQSTILYIQYSDFCSEGGYKAVNRTEFLRRLEELLGFKVVRKCTNNQTWVYCKKVYKDESNEKPDSLSNLLKS